MRQVRHFALVTILVLGSGAGITNYVGACAGTVIHRTATAQHTLRQAIEGFQNVEIAEYNKGFVPADRHLKIQTIVQKVAIAGVDLDNFVSQGATATTVKAKFDAIYNLLDSLNTEGILGIKNPDTKALLETALDAIKAIVDTYLVGVK